MVEHKLKCFPVYFDAIKRGEKTFEVRRDDRGFQRGDIVVLQRTCEEGNKHWVDTYLNGEPKHQITFRIGWILTGGQFGIEPGYVVFSLEAVSGEGEPKQ